MWGRGQRPRSRAVSWFQKDLGSACRLLTCQGVVFPQMKDGVG